MSNNRKTVGINLFSPIGITIALVIVIPIFSFIILSGYFPQTLDTMIVKLGLARYDDNSTRRLFTTEQSPAQSSRIFLGTSQTGYELWADKSCVYVKGITEADLARLNTNVWVFKDEVKAQTGYKCVLFE